MRSPGLFSFLAAVLLSACGVGPSRVPSDPAGHSLLPLTGLTVHQTAPLDRDPHGLRGRLELLLDARLTEAQWDGLWGTGETDLVEPQPAVLQVVDTLGGVQDRQVLDRPLARLEAERLALPGDSLWLLTVDYSASAGSYNGPVTLPLTVREGRIRPLEAGDEKGTSTPVRLMRALKSDWQVVPARSGQGQDILYVFTRPNFEKSGEFEVTYERLSFEGQRWVRHARKEWGLWESEGEFPARELFP